MGVLPTCLGILWPRLKIMIRLVFVTFCLLLSDLCLAESSFTHKILERGIEVDVPADWTVIPPPINNAISTSAEATADQLGMKDAFATTKAIIAVVARTPLYAQIRIESDVPPILKKAELITFLNDSSGTFGTEVKKELESLLRKMLSIQGFKLIEVYPPRVEMINGFPAMVSQYRRTGIKGNVFVETYSIATDYQTVNLTMSCRENEKIIWKPVLDKVKRSLSIKK